MDKSFTFSKPITEIIQQRFSCRTYLEQPIESVLCDKLQVQMEEDAREGPFGTSARFSLVAASEQDRQALKGLGTYGFIQGATGFIMGAVKPAVKDLEDFGYLMEYLILAATDLGLGTCWLGGSFTRSNFTRKIDLQDDEQMPAVTSIGHIQDIEQAKNGLIRRQAGGHSRYPWQKQFFDQEFGLPLSQDDAGEYAAVLEMVRWAPSASNKQPWRMVKAGRAWHFYLKRNGNYPPGFASRLLKIADLQRVDLGIAMCHFELTARELGLGGRWIIDEPDIRKPDELMEYTASWV